MVGDEQLKSGSKKGGKRHFELFLGIFTSPTLPIETQGALPKYPLFTTLCKTRNVVLNRVGGGLQAFPGGLTHSAGTSKDASNPVQ